MIWCALEPDDDAFNFQNSRTHFDAIASVHTFWGKCADGINSRLRWHTHNYKTINFRFAKYSNAMAAAIVPFYSFDTKCMCENNVWRNWTAAATSNGLITCWLFGKICNARQRQHRKWEKKWSPRIERKTIEFWNFPRIFAVSLGVDARCMRRPAALFFCVYDSAVCCVCVCTTVRLVDAGMQAARPLRCAFFHDLCT